MKLLIVEDDIPFANTLGRRLKKYGFTCFHATNSNDALLICHRERPKFILLDMNLVQAHNSESGLALIVPMRSACPDAHIVLLTGFASIATAVDAIKLGANDYLSKPIDTKTLLAALNMDDNAKNSTASTNNKATSDIKLSDDVEEFNDTKLMSAEEVEWQHIQQVLKFNKGNISETARQLSMHRRTLQRKLQKRPSFKS